MLLHMLKKKKFLSVFSLISIAMFLIAETFASRSSVNRFLSIDNLYLLLKITITDDQSLRLKNTNYNT